MQCIAVWSCALLIMWTSPHSLSTYFMVTKSEFGWLGAWLLGGFLFIWNQVSVAMHSAKHCGCMYVNFPCSVSKRRVWPFFYLVKESMWNLSQILFISLSSENNIRGLARGLLLHVTPSLWPFFLLKLSTILNKGKMPKWHRSMFQP